MAHPRQLASELETARLSQLKATKALDEAQAAYFGESGEVARLEQELKHLHARRQRLEVEIRTTASRRDALQQEIEAIRGEIVQHQAALAHAEAQAAVLAKRVAEASRNLPEAESAWREAQAAVAALQADLSRLEQRIRLEEANQAHADKCLRHVNCVFCRKKRRLPPWTGPTWRASRRNLRRPRRAS